MKQLFTWIVFILFVCGTFVYLMFMINSSFGTIENYQQFDTNKMKEFIVEKRTRQAIQRKQIENIQKLFDEKCLVVEFSKNGNQCNAERDPQKCVYSVDPYDLYDPACLEYVKEKYQEIPEDGVRAIYMSSYVASNKSFRDSLVRLVETTDLNAIVIDIKEVEGYVNYHIEDKTGEQFPYQRNLMFDIEQFIEELHEKDIYVIGRIVVFKDGLWAQDNPGDAVQKKSASGVPWKDYGGKTYVDPGARDYWDYVIAIADTAYRSGFDEINLDYIRYPSDGNMEDTFYPHSDDVLIEYGLEDGRVAIINDFSQYVTRNLREKHPEITISGDVFGMVSTARDDVTIGQRLEPMLLAYDYISPMVYPSHYQEGFITLPGHPDLYPYEVVYKAQQTAQERSDALRVRLGQIQISFATTTDTILQDILGTHTEHKNTDIDNIKVGALRPWLQDFTCTWCKTSKPYQAVEIQAQIAATLDAGQQGWMLWDAGNRYRGYRAI
jgi:hypothetical protein